MSMKELSFLDAQEEYRKVGDTYHHFDELFKSMTDEKLEFVTSCLVVGPGSGFLELNFFFKLVPILKKVVFLEPNEACIKALKENLSTSHISSLEITIEPVKAEEWKNEKKKKFDLVLTFDSMYYVQKRQAFLLNCLQNWMNVESVFFILLADDSKNERGYGELWTEVNKKLGLKRWIDIGDIKKDLNEIGRTFEKEYKCDILKDLDSINDGMIQFMFYEVNPPPSLKEVRRVISELRDEGYVGRVPQSIISIRNRV